MGFMDKFRDLMGTDGEEDFLEEDDMEFISNSGERYDGYDDEEFKYEERPRRDNKVVNINATTQLQVVLVKPENFSDGSAVADHLNARRTVVLNLESTNREVSRRLVDFLSGVAYANNGQIKRVAQNTFIITPYNVDIMGDSILDELENSGVVF